MRRTASSIRVALEHVCTYDRPTRLAFYRLARRRNAAMENTLSVEVALKAHPSDWRGFDDPHGRGYDKAMSDLGAVSRSLGKGEFRKMTKGRDKVTFFVEYEGGDEDKAMYDLEKQLSKELKELARDDDGLAALLYGVGSKGTRLPNLDPDVEHWAG